MIRAMERVLLCCHSSRREQSLGISVANSEVDKGFHTMFVIIPCYKATLFPGAELLNGCLVVFFAG
jgi:hypothetical protein